MKPKHLKGRRGTEPSTPEDGHSKAPTRVGDHGPEGPGVPKSASPREGEPTPPAGARKKRSIMLTDEIWKRLSHVAIDLGKDRSELVEEWIQARLDEQERVQRDADEAQARRRRPI
jgi:predicted DNA-binding protein